jgi:integrase
MGGRRVRKSLDCPESERARARRLRDVELGKLAERQHGAEPVEPLPDLTLGELVTLYLASECGQYDRDGSDEQPGTKRSAHTDRSTLKRLRRLADFSRPATAVKVSDVIALRDAIDGERTAGGKPLGAGTRRKPFAFLRRVYNWSLKRPEKTGIESSPFVKLDSEDRLAMFPRSPETGQAIPSEALVRIYGRLRPEVARIVRFAAHTAARPEEFFNMKWGWVDLAEGVVNVDRRYSKTWKRTRRDRVLYLNRVAKGILEQIRPSNTSPDANVFTHEDGSPVRSIRTSWDRAVKGAKQTEEQRRRGVTPSPGVWTRSAASPRPWVVYDLRHTGISAMSEVASWPITQRFAGHAIAGVTGRYFHKDTDEIRAKADEAAHLIDGAERQGVVEGQFSRDREATKQATVSESAAG